MFLPENATATNAYSFLVIGIGSLYLFGRLAPGKTRGDASFW